MRKTLVATAATALLFVLMLVAKNPTTQLQAAVVSTDGNTTVITGPAISITHGLVQVQVTLDKNGRISAVQALHLPHDNDHSWEDSLHAVPILEAEVLKAQSANIDVVSGATYTSRAYAQSLQAALDAQ